jgi:putative endonuclease
MAHCHKCIADNIAKNGLDTDNNYKGIVLYTGVTANLYLRVNQHKKAASDLTHPFTIQNVHFTKYYHCDKLVFFQQLNNIVDAIKKEKHVKHLGRKQKLKLITDFNPKWNDLYYQLTTLL